jgi:hypothetical protein
MNYSFLPEAETEYLEAVRFYEEQQAKRLQVLIAQGDTDIKAGRVTEYANHKLFNRLNQK